jgi:hypothetical protein
MLICGSWRSIVATYGWDMCSVASSFAPARVAAMRYGTQVLGRSVCLHPDYPNRAETRGIGTLAVNFTPQLAPDEVYRIVSRFSRYRNDWLVAADLAINLWRWYCKQEWHWTLLDLSAMGGREIRHPRSQSAKRCPGPVPSTHQSCAQPL